MAKHRSTFDWSILDRKGLVDLFWQLYPELCGQEISISKFHNKLSLHIKKHLPVKIKKSRDQKVEFDWVYVGGTYYSDMDCEKQQCIELVLVYNTFQDKLNMSAKRYHRMCYTIADTILHEIMHMRQYRRRKFKILPDYASTAEKTEQRAEQEYLGCSDEVDAYSFNIACELMDKFKYDPVQVIQYLNEDQKGLRRRHNSWRMYLKAFDHNHDHTIIKRLKKKIIKYLPRAINGKPYRNKDWISR
jgi:hypothetical protein